MKRRKGKGNRERMADIQSLVARQKKKKKGGVMLDEANMQKGGRYLSEEYSQVL